MAPYKRIWILGFILLSILTFFAYYSGLNGPFVFDDIANITENPDTRISTLNSQEISKVARLDEKLIPNRYLAKISFAINYLMANHTFNPYTFKSTNLFIHLINAFLIYWLTFLLAEQIRTKFKTNASGKYFKWFPLLVASLWVLHPLQLTSVLYVVQRMTSMSALFLLLGLITAFYGRLQIQKQQKTGVYFLVGGLIGGVLFGSACKENAALLPFFMLLTEWLFFDRSSLRKEAKVSLYWIYGLVLCPYFLGLAWLALNPDKILESYVIREFTIQERILTEPRILGFYMYLLLAPNLKEFSLFHDDIVLSTALLSPWTTLFAWIVLLASLGIAVVYRMRHPVLSFAILWFLIGHSIESSFIGLEIAHEHRNYVPSIGPIFGICYGLIAFYSKLKTHLLLITFTCLLVLGLFITTYLRADTWKSEESVVLSMVRNHPDSPRSHFMAGEWYAVKENNYPESLAHYYRAFSLSPHETGILIQVAHRYLNIKFESKKQFHRFVQLAQQNNVHKLPLPFKLNENRGGYYSVRLNREYSDYISRQLSQKLPTENTQQIMFGFVNCLQQNNQQCLYIQKDIIHWYQSVLDNPLVKNDLYKEYVIQLFEIGVNSKNWELALNAIQKGMGRDSHDIEYILMTANIYILDGKTDIAEKLINSVLSSNREINTNIRNNAERLLSILNTKRNRN